jgi:hypothetical protein
MEDQFLNDNETRCIVSIGSKGSGKTTTLINYLDYCFKNNKFSHYYLCIPEIDRAKGGTQYSFIKKNKKCTIYTKYNPTVTMQVMKKATGKEKILFVIEDATQYGKLLKEDQNLLQMMTTSRHIKCQVWLILHATRNVMSVAVRSNIDYLFVNKITNRKLLEAIWEEYFSLYYYPNFRDFLTYFKQIQETPYNGIFIDTIKLKYDEIKNMPTLYGEKQREEQKEEKKSYERKDKNIFSRLLLYNKNK